MTPSYPDRKVSRRTALFAFGAAGIGASLVTRSAFAQDTAGLSLAGQPLVELWVATPTTESLVSLVLDSALLTVPQGAAVCGHVVDEPGWSQTISFPTTSAAIVHVNEGVYAVRSDGPVTVVRPSADGMAVAENIPPGEEVTTQAGETMLHLSSSHLEERNAGDIPTDRYTFVVVGDGEPTIENRQGTSNGEFLAAIEPDPWSSLPAGPVTITFAVEDAGAAGTATPVTGLQMAGELGGSPPRRLVISVTPGALPGATPVDLSFS